MLKLRTLWYEYDEKCYENMKNKNQQIDTYVTLLLM